MTDPDALQGVITAYTQLTVRPDPAGGRMLSNGPDDVAQRLHEEIAQTRLPRRLEFFAGPTHRIALRVRNGRVFAVGASLEILDDAENLTQSDDVFAGWLQQIADFVHDAEQLSVQTHRWAGDVAEGATGMQPPRPEDILAPTDDQQIETAMQGLPEVLHDAKAYLLLDAGCRVAERGDPDMLDRLWALSEAPGFPAIVSGVQPPDGPNSLSLGGAAQGPQLMLLQSAQGLYLAIKAVH